MAATKNKIFGQAGFTLLELSISLIIFVLITAFAIANIKGGTRNEKLKTARTQLIEDLKKMQNYSLTGRTCETGDAASCTAGSVPARGYGLYITRCASNCSYVLFSDTLAGGVDYHYDGGEQLNNGIVKFNKDIIVSNFSSNGSDDNGPINVVFAPYSTTITMNGASAGGGGGNGGGNGGASSIDQEVITLRDIKTNNTTQVRIQRSLGVISE